MLNPKFFSVTVEFSGLSVVLQGLAEQFPEILYSVLGSEHLVTVKSPVYPELQEAVTSKVLNSKLVFVTVELSGVSVGPIQGLAEQFPEMLYGVLGAEHFSTVKLLV